MTDFFSELDIQKNPNTSNSQGKQNWFKLGGGGVELLVLMLNLNYAANN